MKLQSIRGMHDVLPEDSFRWQYLESCCRALTASFGYQEIRMPIVEKTELFCRSIGEVTDIVEKEMYSFTDRNGDGLTLRPEGTASCVRACIEHGLLRNQSQRLWYMGPMFRHERPQKGRYRQFHQLGVETFGLEGPDVDVELILMAHRLWKQLGLTSIKLEINSLGSSQARAHYREALVAFLETKKSQLDEDSQRRLQSNPLRVLDSKVPETQALLDDAPRMQAYLDEDSRQHFAELCTMLDKLGIPYQVNPKLVRGLDYYNKTVFEWVTDQLGAQATVCAGGRFDGLVDQLGGPNVPAAGFAIGLERILVLLEENQCKIPRTSPQIFCISQTGAARVEAFLMAEQIRNAIPAVEVQSYLGTSGFKAQFKQADKVGAQFALILGEDELREGKVGIKSLRLNTEQQSLSKEAVISFLQANLLNEQ